MEKHLKDEADHLAYTLLVCVCHYAFAIAISTNCVSVNLQVKCIYMCVWCACYSSTSHFNERDYPPEPAINKWLQDEFCTHAKLQKIRELAKNMVRILHLHGIVSSSGGIYKCHKLKPFLKCLPLLQAKLCLLLDLFICPIIMCMYHPVQQILRYWFSPSLMRSNLCCVNQGFPFVL